MRSNYISPNDNIDQLQPDQYYPQDQQYADNLLQPNSDGAYMEDAARYSSNLSKTSLTQEEPILSISEYNNVFEDFKIAAEGHAQNLQNSVLSIKHKTDHIQNELDNVQSSLEKLASNARQNSNTSISPIKDSLNSSKYSRSRYNPLRGRDNALEDRLERYKQNAEDRKSQNRSVPRYNEKAISDHAKSIRKLRAALEAREQDFEALKEIIEDNENDKFAFIFHTESLVQIVNQNFKTESAVENEDSKLEEPRNEFYSSFQGRKMPPQDNSGSYYDFNESRYQKQDTPPETLQQYDSIKMQDLQRTNELLLKELRKANDK